MILRGHEHSSARKVASRFGAARETPAGKNRQKKPAPKEKRTKAKSAMKAVPKAVGKASMLIFLRVRTSPDFRAAKYEPATSDFEHVWRNKR
jgi:hypothetical protein